MTDTTSLLLSPFRFAGYLATLAPDTDVGATHFPLWSPLSRFLYHETGVRYEIWRYNYTVYVPDEEYVEMFDDTDDPLLPLWAVIFGVLVDGRKDSYGSPITAAYALRCVVEAEHQLAQRFLA